jgi:hypothetical protein
VPRYSADVPSGDQPFICATTTCPSCAYARARAARSRRRRSAAVSALITLLVVLTVVALERFNVLGSDEALAWRVPTAR